MEKFFIDFGNCYIHRIDTKYNKKVDTMITCSVCGHLNSPSRATCEECGSDLSDSEDWGIFDDDEFDDDMLNFDEAEEMGYVDPDFYE